MKINIDNELNCVDLIKAVIKIHNICNSKSMCDKCVFWKNRVVINALPCGCIINDFPYDWEVEELSNWLKEHKSEEIIAHWENIKTAKNTIKCSNCGHIRELKHFNEIIKRPMFCEMCGMKMKESEETK